MHKPFHICVITSTHILNVTQKQYQFTLYVFKRRLSTYNKHIMAKNKKGFKSLHTSFKCFKSKQITQFIITEKDFVFK